MTKAQDDRIIASMASLSGDVRLPRAAVSLHEPDHARPDLRDVTRRDIERNFPKVDKALLNRAILDALDGEEIAIAPRSGRASQKRPNGAYVYYTPETP